MTLPELAVQILVQLPGNVNTVIARHGGRKNILDHVWPEKEVPSKSQTPKGRSLRQPAPTLERWLSRRALDRRKLAGAPAPPTSLSTAFQVFADD